MFRTALNPRPSPNKIHIGEQLVSLGSCFAENMGKRLSQHKFKTIKNPFGTIFNPLSIFELLELAHQQGTLPTPSFQERNGLFFNYKVHSKLNGGSQGEIESNIYQQRNKLKKSLNRANHVILTFGTAWVYEEKKSKMLVANCHKVPPTQFNKRLLSVEEIIASFMSTKELLQGTNPGLKFILTVSPVRHLKETHELNAVSKSILRLACHHLSSFAENIEYFPAYELMMDDLRDYRFYKKDMLHPNEQAQDYIWEKFRATYFDKKTNDFVKEWAEVRSALNHRAFQPESDAHQKFLANTISRIQRLKELVNVNKELKKLNSQLN
ncbi:MAG: lysophospholipase L1-like esterase [Roseivirga sp.]|jgi:lysophospholipase L1-like esterase